MLELRWCAPCRSEQPFEVPPCADGHGADCPDLACTACGSGIVLGTGFDQVVAERDVPLLSQPVAA